jgi:hypothetical protein
MLRAFHSHGNLSLTSENFKLVTERKAKPFRVRPITIAKGVRGVALEIEGVELQRGLRFG